MKPDIYEPAGWINAPWIASRPTWLKVLIGARQVGKTYGVLLHYLQTREPFILLRRTTDELKFIGSSAELDPFTAFLPEYRTRINAAGGAYTIVDYDEEGNIIPGSNRGIAMSLPQVAHVRGFNGSRFKAVVFDEAVPEKGVRVLRTEGDALLNAYTTISGNRELTGEPPLTLWLLANTNNINSPILDALNLTDDIVKMQARGTEYLERDGVSIFQGRSEAVTSARRDTVLARRVDPGGAFARMAYGNEWAYDQSPVIRQRNIKGMRPVCSYADKLFIWEDDSSVYVCGARHKAERYADNDFERAQFISQNRWLVSWYAAGMVTFSDIKLLALFKRVFDIDY